MNQSINQSINLSFNQIINPSIIQSESESDGVSRPIQNHNQIDSMKYHQHWNSWCGDSAKRHHIHWIVPRFLTAWWNDPPCEEIDQSGELWGVHGGIWLVDVVVMCLISQAWQYTDLTQPRVYSRVFIRTQSEACRPVSHHVSPNQFTSCTHQQSIQLASMASSTFHKPPTSRRAYMLTSCR